jgi:hypothetical protein
MLQADTCVPPGSFSAAGDGPVVRVGVLACYSRLLLTSVVIGATELGQFALSAIFPGPREGNMDPAANA